MGRKERWGGGEGGGVAYNQISRGGSIGVEAWQEAERSSAGVCQSRCVWGICYFTVRSQGMLELCTLWDLQPELRWHHCGRIKPIKTWCIRGSWLTDSHWTSSDWLQRSPWKTHKFGHGQELVYNLSLVEAGCGEIITDGHLSSGAPNACWLLGVLLAHLSSRLASSPGVMGETSGRQAAISRPVKR